MNQKSLRDFSFYTIYLTDLQNKVLIKSNFNIKLSSKERTILSRIKKKYEYSNKLIQDLYIYNISVITSTWYFNPLLLTDPVAFKQIIDTILGTEIDSETDLVDKVDQVLKKVFLLPSLPDFLIG